MEMVKTKERAKRGKNYTKNYDFIHIGNCLAAPQTLVH